MAKMEEKIDQGTWDLGEIDKGYNISEAIDEAKRCLDCKKPSCRKGCPIENEIPNFIQALAKGNLGEAAAIIAARSNLPAVCGRVCAHERQCEAACILTKKNTGVRIGKLERFIADFEAKYNLNAKVGSNDMEGKVAVVGSGPAGLTIAGDLAKEGYEVTVFDAQPEPGGVLMYGIPEYRLSKEVVRREVNKIEGLGVNFKNNIRVGADITVDNLFEEGFDAVFVGTGTCMPRAINLPGDNLSGVIQATYFLRTVALVSSGELDKREVSVRKGDKVVVIGAGNVAMDAARTALKIGAGEVTILSRTNEQSMPALKVEYEHAKEEGVNFKWSANPTAFLGQKQVTTVTYEPLLTSDEDSVEYSEGFEEIQADVVILAIGQQPASTIISTTKGIKVNEQGYVITRERPYGMTTRAGIFAGGDVVHKPATVVLAMKEAKKVAEGISLYIHAKKLMEDVSASSM